ncbi:MAG: permease [Lachnospiraceae bacterium]|nr:permease [Lachnospiraceae bacterium]
MIAEILKREFIYVGYYFVVQFKQIFGYWVVGMIIGSVVSVFFKDKIHNLMREMKGATIGFAGIVFASLLGIASPLCMYGTIPIAASFSKGGIKDEWLASFMMSSILLNPQLIIYSAALGIKALLVRIISCFLCGITAGLMVRLYCTLIKRKQEKKKQESRIEGPEEGEQNEKEAGAEPDSESVFFNFHGFDEPKSRDTHPNLFIRFLKNLLRNIKATGLYFLIGILLSALFQRYVPKDAMTLLFGGNEAWGVLMAATVGVPLYVCGGGTIPILQAWMAEGMSMGSACAFMITGPATKITNLGALKSVLGIRNFIFYWLYVGLFSILAGVIVNLIMLFI